MKYFQFNKKYLDMYSPGQDLNHLTNPSWEWRSYAVPTTPQNLERSINKIDIYSNRLPHKYEKYWTAWGYIMQSRTILVLRLIPDKGRSKALPLFIAMRGISNNFLVHLPSWHDELRVCKLQLGQSGGGGGGFNPDTFNSQSFSFFNPSAMTSGRKRSFRS